MHTRPLAPAAPSLTSPARLSSALPVQGQGQGPGRQVGLARFNAASADSAREALLACCGSGRWARRLAAHRPYPDVEALLAAGDEASYDLSAGDLSEALAAEADGPSATCAVHRTAPPAARTALSAASAAYESTFGHAFVMNLGEHRPEEQLDRVLAGIRARLNNRPDEEWSVTADELRRLARTRLQHLAGTYGSPQATASPR